MQRAGPSASSSYSIVARAPLHPSRRAQMDSKFGRSSAAKPLFARRGALAFAAWTFVLFLFYVMLMELQKVLFVEEILPSAYDCFMELAFLTILGSLLMVSFFSTL